MSGKSAHSDDFKRKAVAALRNRGNRSADDIARGLGVSTAVIYFWRKEYGDGPAPPTTAEPIRGRGREYPEDFRRRAVQALRDRGSQTTQEVATSLGVPRSAIYKWQAEFGMVPQRGAPRSNVVSNEDVPNERTGYSTRKEDTELEQLREQRDRLAVEAAALRKTIVLLGRTR